MNTQEHERYLQEYRDYLEKLTATKESAQKFLLDAGIHDSPGKLSKNYSLNGSDRSKVR